ncbi:MAG: 50S ribosomal protein L23 [Bacilli bacterium]|nr:50S ribosomal protein L23 [Bacilli bacterium]
MDTKYLEIIKAPLITEKSRDREALNQYSFKVSPKASKIEIKEAVEKIFKVDVLEVRTSNMPVKKKRVGRYAGLSNRCKKAIVTLKPGQTIEMQ